MTKSRSEPVESRPTAGQRRKSSSGSTSREIKSFTGMTEGGANRIARFYQQMGKRVLSRPEYNPETTLWEFEVEW